MILRLTRIAWIAVAVLVLCVTLYGFDGKPNSDIDVLLIWAMLVLTLPIGFVIALLLSGISIAAHLLFSTTIQTSYPVLFGTWICFVLAGYWQWFMLLPFLRSKWKAHRSISLRSDNSRTT